MDNRKDNNYYLKKILIDIEFLLDQTKGLLLEDIKNNPY